MRQRIIVLLMLVPLVLCTTTAFASWGVDIQSKTVNAGDVGVTVGVTGHWDLAISSISIPMVARNVSGGAFWAGPLPYDTGGNGYWHPYAQGVTWSWLFPWAALLEEFNPKKPVAPCATEGDVAYDAISPDHFLIASVGSGAAPPAEPAGRTFCTFSFTAGAAGGTFEFDTACFTPTLTTLSIIDNAFPPVEHGPLGTNQAVFNVGTITVIGPTLNEPPVITCPANPTVNIGQLVNATVTATDDHQPDPPDAITLSAEDVPGFLGFTDNGGGSGTLTGTPGCGDPGQYTIRLIANDSELADTCFLIVTVNADTEDPVLTCGGDVTVGNAAGLCEAVVNLSGHSTATDNCPGVVVSYAPVSGSTFPKGTTLVTATATDAAGNTATCTFNVIVQDTEDPVLTCGSDVTVGNTPGLCEAVVNLTGHSTATDNCPGVVVSYNPASGSTFPVGTTLVTATATDAAGKAVSCTFNVIVQDTEDPVITCPANLAVGASDPTDPDHTGYATATDNCADPVTITYSDQLGANEIQRTWQADDGNGNIVTCLQIITITEANLAPQFTNCPDIAVEVTEGGAVSYTPLASDPNSDPVTITAENLPPSATFTGGTFSWTTGCDDAGSYTVRFIASDGELANTCEYGIIVLDDPAVIVADVGTLYFNYTIGDPLPAAQQVHITNDGCGELMVFGNESDAWISDDPTEAMTPVTFDVTVDPSGFAAGTYTGSIFYIQPPNGLAKIVEGALVEIVLVVSAGNMPPEITNCPISTQVVEGQTLIYAPGATDPNGDPLTFTAENMPAGATFIGNVFTWTAPCGDAGLQYSVKVIASDGELADTCDFTIDVLAAAIEILTDVDTLIFDYQIGDPAPAAQQVNVSSANCDLLVAALPALPWAMVNPIQAITPAAFDVTVDPSSLPPGLNVTQIFFGQALSKAAGPEPPPIPGVWVTVILNITDCIPEFQADIDTLVFDWQVGDPAPAAQAVNVASVGCGGEFMVYWNGTQPWITADPLEAMTPASFDVGIDVAGLTPGTHTGSIEFLLAPFIAGARGIIGATVPIVLNVTPEIVCGDTCWVSHESGAVGETVGVQVNFKNCVDLAGMTIPLRWNPDVVTLESIDYSGSRVDYITLKADAANINNAANTVYLWALVQSEPNIAPGEGLFATLNFHIDACSAEPVVIDTAFISPTGYFAFADPTGQLVETDFVAGSITVESGTPDITVDPETLSFEGSVGEVIPCQSLQLSTAFCGDLGWNAGWNATWLSVSPQTGNLPYTVEVCVDATGLPGGTYTDVICIMLEQGTLGKSASTPPCAAMIPVTFVVVEETPIIRLDAGLFRFAVSNNDCDPGPTDADVFHITNMGGGSLDWTALWKESWLDVSPVSGTAPSEVVVTVDGTGLAPDTYIDTIRIDANAINTPQYVIVHMEVVGCERGDTVWVGTGTGTTGDDIVVPVLFSNSGPLSGISVPLIYNTAQVTAVSADFTGSRVDYLDPSHRIVMIDDTEGTICIAAIPFSEGMIPAGTGLFVNLHFTVESADGCPFAVGIDSTFIAPGCQLMFTDEFTEPVYPVFFAGQIDVTCPPVGGICGRILNEAGAPLEGCADVYAAGLLVGSACAGPDGYFCVDDLPDGCFDVRVRKVGYCTEVFEEVCNPTEMGTIVLTAFDAPIVTPYVADYWGTAPTLYGLPLYEGDVITAVDPDGVTCGAAYVDANGDYLIHVYGDDKLVTPAIDEGAESGDAITFLLNCECELTAANLWVNHGSFEENPAFICERRQEIPLCGDWSLISYNVSVGDQSVENVLSSIDGMYDLVISSTCEDGAVTFDITRPPQLNDLEVMDNDHGYWVYAPGAETLVITGTPVPPNTPLELCMGWNVISYLPNMEDDIFHAWSTIDSELEYAIGYDCEFGAQTFDPQRPVHLNDLTCLRPGSGYWVKLYSAATLTYPAAEYGCEDLSPLPKPVNLTSVVEPTPWVSDFWSNGNAHGPAEGAVLTVHDEDGVVCGQTVVLDGGMFLIHVYGDDPNTNRDEGADLQSILTFTVDDVEYDVIGDNSWVERRSAEITLSRSGSAGQIPAAFELMQNYPNPFNPKTTIRFRMPEGAQVELAIYNVLGRKVRTLVDEYYPAGEHEVEWNGRFDDDNTAESGVYFYRISTDTFTNVRKMTLLK
jgi:hypothetical protein